MKRTVNHQTSNGFSLVELLVVIAVIGLIAAIALPSLSKITDKARKASAQKNAQTLCTLHTNARSAGAGFSATTRGGILDELVVGVTGTIVASDFKMGALPENDQGDSGWEHYTSSPPELVQQDVIGLNNVQWQGYAYRVGRRHSLKAWRKSNTAFLIAPSDASSCEASSA